MESGPQCQESSVVATSQGMAYLNKDLPLSKTATELNTAAESSNWTLVDDHLSVDGVSRCDLKQCCLLQKLAAAPEVSLSLARDILRKILKHKVDINMMDTNKDTALLLAARCDNCKMVMELLSRRAALPSDVTHVCSFLQTLTNNWKPQETPYMHALVVKLLWDRLKDTALHSCHTQLHHTLVRLAVTFHTSLVRHMFVTQQQVNAVDSEGMAVLHRVAMFDTDDHVRLVLFLIIKGADVNLQSTTGDTPLHVAVKHNNWTMMEALLHRRANSDVIDCEQRSVLHIVASYTDSEDLSKLDKILPLLIRNSKDINKRDGEGNTALHLAALAGNTWFMKTLLDHGARADGVNNEQKTVLHMMAIAENKTSQFYSILNMSLTIMKKDADIQKTDCAGDSALHLAAKHDNWDLVQLFLRYVDDVSNPDSEGFNILHRFVMKPYSTNQEVCLILTYRVSGLNSKSHSGDSAIHLAAKCQNWDIVKLLVEEGALIDELDNEGFHVLHRMAMGKSLNNDLLSLLMAKSINFNICCLAGDTVVHMAARHDNWPMVKCLIEHVENIDEVDSEGFAVIQRLVLSTKEKLPSYFSLFIRVIELGADYTCRDQNGDTVLHLAARNGHWDIVNYLLQLGERTDTPDSEGFVILHRASVRGTPDSSARELFHSLLKYKPDLDKRTRQGDTAIHLAAKHDQWEIVMTLIEHSANVFDCDSEDTSVLQRMLQNRCSLQYVLSILQLTVNVNTIQQHRDFFEELVFEAAKSSNWDVIKFLVNQGVTTDHVDSEGLSFLHNITKGITTQCQHQNLNELLKVLLDMGMDLERKCARGNTPLQLAAKYHNWDLVSYLLLQGASIYCPDNEGVFVLQRLAMYSNYHESQREILKHLIEAGADLKVRCTNGDSLLHLGAKANNWLFVSHIIQEEINLDLDELDSDGFNILHRLAQDDKGSEWVEAFVVLRLNLDTLCGNGDTCLLLAAKRENWNFVNRLLTHIQKPSWFEFQNIFLETLNSTSPADCSHDFRDTAKRNVDTRDRRGYTVWHHAVMRKQLDIIFELLNCGANTNSIDDEGFNLLQRLVSDNLKGIENVMTILKEKGFSFTQKDKLGNTLLQVVAKNKSLPLVAYFLDYVDDVRSKDSDGLPLLHRAVNIIPDSNSSDHENIVERLLKSGADPKEMSWDGNTPLDLAAKKRKWTIVRLLLKYGAPTSMCDSEGLSVLHRLACHGYTSIDLIQTPFGPKYISVSSPPILKNLIQHGASIKQKDLQGNTPLHLAVKHQSWDVATELVQCGAQVNEVDHEGYTVLHRLAKREHLGESFLSPLLEKGAICDIVSDHRETICETVVESENWGMMKILLTHGTFAISEHIGKCLLHRLASSFHRYELTSVFELLIEKGLSVNAKDLDGNTPLHIAVRSCSWNLFTHLLLKGASGRPLDGKGFSILHTFVSDLEREPSEILALFSTTILDVILSTGVDVNARDPQGNTALHIAAKRRLTVIMSRLIDSVDNLNTTDSDGFSVLLRLSQTPSRECLSLCQRLVEKGVDINAISTDGQSALELAVKNNNWPVVELLINSGARFVVEILEGLHPLHNLIKHSTFSEDNQLKLMTLLTGIGLSVSTQDLRGKTPAELAFTLKKWKLFKYLLESGAHLNETLRKGNSYFHEIAKHTSVCDNLTDITRLLLSRGFDINLINDGGDTPVHVAANKGNWDTVKTFVEHGANTSIPDSKGFCLLHKFLNKRTQRNANARCYARTSTCESLNDLLIGTLVPHSEDVNRRGPDNKTALEIAIGNNEWEIVVRLISLGAVFELNQDEKLSALKHLHLGDWKDVSREKLHLFIKHITNDGSDINNSFEEEYGFGNQKTMLQKCVDYVNWKMAIALAECGADVSQMFSDKIFLDMMMSAYLQVDHSTWTCFLDLLITKGLDINTKLIYQSGILFCDEVGKSLEESEENVTSCLFSALLERGADPLLVDSRGYSLLRTVVDFGGQSTLNALKKLLPAGVTTHQPRLTEATLLSQRSSSKQTVSPTEKAIKQRNICAVKLLIQSGASSNSELFRLNTEYQVKLAEHADMNKDIRELLEVLNKAASEPRSLQSLCRLSVSHWLGCGPGRAEKLKSLKIPSSLKKLISFCDLLSTELLLHKREDLNTRFSEEDVYLSVSSDYSDSDSDEDYDTMLSVYPRLYDSDDLFYYGGQDSLPFHSNLDYSFE